MSNRISLIIFLFFTINCGSVHYSSPAPEKMRMVRVPYDVLSEIRAKGVDFQPEYLRSKNYAVGYVDMEQISKLEPPIKNIKFLDERKWAVGKYNREIFDDDSSDEIITDELFDGYHNYEQLTSALKQLVDAHPTLLQLKTAGKSVQGRELWYVVVSDNVGQNENEPKFIYHANMHGDEAVSRELMIYLLQFFMEQYGKDEKITALINNSEIFIMPSMNPDGFELARRSNANGYDLNRNFPDRFDSPDDTPNGRQIEVQRMMGLAKENHFVYGINWHGGEVCFNLPWGNIANTTANKYWDDAMFYTIGREYTKFNQTMYNNDYENFDHGLTYGYEWYPVNGGINDWMNYYRRAIHAVVEVSSDKWPTANTLQRYWDENREAMITYLWRGLRGVHLEIRDEYGLLVENPEIILDSAPGRHLRFDTGFVHRLSGEGKQKVKIIASGYQEKTVELNASYFNGAFTKVVLKKAGQYRNHIDG